MVDVYYGHMNKPPLYIYVIALAVVWTIILGTTWFLGNVAVFHTFSVFFGGFALGMLAMYIAVHIYRWK